MKKLAILVFGLCILMQSQIAFSAQAGLVLIAKGGAFATDTTGTQRPLKRRSKIMEGDIISTDDKGMIQIRFVDKALLTLKANSKLDISAYQQAKEQGEDEQVVMNLITGGFRTITGSIGKGDKSAYKVKTPAASIGIRGTNYEVAQEVEGNFVMAVWDGGITVSNDQGSLDIGQDSDFIFVRVSANTEPQGLEEAPDSFGQTSTPLPLEEKSEEDEQNSDSGDKNDNESNKQDSEDASTDEEQNQPAETDTADTEADAEADAEDAGTEVATTTSEEDAKDSQLEEELDEVEEEADSLIEDTPLVDVERVSSTDSRFSDWEYSYLLQRPKAALVIGGNSQPIQNGLMVQDFDAGTDPVFITGGANTGTDNNLQSFTLTSSGLSDVTERVSGSEHVSWGKWNGTSEIFSTPNDTSNPLTENQSFYWLSAEAASLSTLRGTASFSGDREFLGEIDGTAITNLNGQFDVDFNTGQIENGALNFGHSEQSWAVNFTGNVKGANAVMNNIQGDITGTNACTECVSGAVQGIFARPGDHFVGGFNLEGGTGTAADGTSTVNQANGLFSLKGK